MSSDSHLGVFRSLPDEVSTSPPSAAERSDEKPAGRSPKLTATKELPSGRLPLDKQLEILRSHVVASNRGGKPVANSELAAMAGMHVNNVSIANPFFRSVGLIKRGPAGYLPSDEAVQYQQAYEWSPETAAHKLAEPFARSWFGESVLRQLELRPRSTREVLAALASLSNAPKDAMPSLQMLLEYMRLAGLILLDGETVSRAATASAPQGRPTAEPTADTPTAAPSPSPVPQTAAQQKARKTSDDGTPGQGVRFSIDLNVSMDEMSGWQPDRIAAFFAGVAQIISAKNGGKPMGG